MNHKKINTLLSLSNDAQEWLKKELIKQLNYKTYRELQERTTAIDQLIKNIEAQIEKLQELRKIRIYEAVTGKIKVNAYAETTA